jgi:hypothetical protein
VWFHIENEEFAAFGNAVAEKPGGCTKSVGNTVPPNTCRVDFETEMVRDPAKATSPRSVSDLMY